MEKTLWSDNEEGEKKFQLMVFGKLKKNLSLLVIK